MLIKIIGTRFGGLRLAITADEIGLAEGGSFRLVSMDLLFHRAHRHDELVFRAVTAT
jgi:hypothetical protein